MDHHFSSGNMNHCHSVFFWYKYQWLHGSFCDQQITIVTGKWHSSEKQSQLFACCSTGALTRLKITEWTHICMKKQTHTHTHTQTGECRVIVQSQCAHTACTLYPPFFFFSQRWMAKFTGSIQMNLLWLCVCAKVLFGKRSAFDIKLRCHLPVTRLVLNSK